MKTELHLKLEKLCRIMIKDPKHWFIKNSSVMWMSELNEHVSVKRAIYAAFVEDIPEDMEVRATKCEASRCVNPDHCSLVPARGTKNRPLSLPWHREQLVMPKKFIPPTPKGRLPFGLTPENVSKVKTMVSAGSSLAQVQLVVKLPMSDIVQIKNGVYDRAAGRVRRELAKKTALTSVRPVDSNYLTDVNKDWDPPIGEAFFASVLEKSITLVPEPVVKDIIEDDKLTVGNESEEQIWLDMMRRNK